MLRPEPVLGPSLPVLPCRSMCPVKVLGEEPAFVRGPRWDGEGMRLYFSPELDAVRPPGRGSYLCFYPVE